YCARIFTELARTNLDCFLLFIILHSRSEPPGSLRNFTPIVNEFSFAAKVAPNQNKLKLH
ncbi:TPA: hypothetical protein ACF2ZB_003218, partial [Yersinia enterocolitica]